MQFMGIRIQENNVFLNNDSAGEKLRFIQVHRFCKRRYKCQNLSKY